MKEKFLQYIANSVKFGSDPDNLKFTETFSISHQNYQKLKNLKKNMNHMSHWLK